MKSPALVLTWVLALPFITWGQQKPLIRFVPLTFEGVSDEEARSIESLFFSYVSDLGDIAESNQSGGPAFTISGGIQLIEENRILNLEIIREPGRETWIYRYSFRTSSELALKARSVIAAAFAGGSQTEAQSAVQSTGESLNAEAVTGTWRAGGGLQMVRLERNGTGMALFASGAVMKLSYTINGSVLHVTQDSPNTERYYHPLPLKIARQLVEQAEPMSWELLLLDRGTVLRGVGIFTGLRYEGDTILELNPGAAREAEWIRSR